MRYRPNNPSHLIFTSMTALALLCFVCLPSIAFAELTYDSGNRLRDDLVRLNKPAATPCQELNVHKVGNMHLLW